MRVRRLLSVGSVACLALAGLVVVAPAASSATEYSPLASTPDGDPGSLREVLEVQAQNGDTVVLEAGATYTLDDCKAGDVDVIASVTIQGNGATVEQTCDDRIFDLNVAFSVYDATLTGGVAFGSGGAIEAGSGSVILDGVTIQGNLASSDGGAIDTGEADLTVIDSTLVNNGSAFDGGAIDNSEGDQTTRIIRSTIASNCAVSDGGAISTESGDSVTLVNSTVTGNVSGSVGAIDVGNAENVLTLVYSDVVGNQIDEAADCGVESDSVASADHDDVGAAATSSLGANVQLAGSESGSTLLAFGSVIANPISAANCGTEEFTTVTSSGYNYADDDSCLLDAATDVQNGADPQLGALASNGGPTPTLLPAAASPLVNAIPFAACGGGDALAGSAITTDQRGLARPDLIGQKCDIGSVELQTEAPVALEPTFTG